MEKKKIKEGVYLVIDPSMALSLLFHRLEEALKTSISAVQVWNNWDPQVDKHVVIEKILNLGAKYDVPILVNNDWSLLEKYPFDGVHFDEIPQGFNEIKRELKRRSITNTEYIFGITCGNDMDVIEWATKNDMDYISFCSMFPSTTSNSCELVSIDSVRRARSISNLPIFLAGGIYPDNMNEFDGVDYQGVAIVSGIMGSINPEERTLQYLEKFNKSQS